jgi:hypothetical protein
LPPGNEIWLGWDFSDGGRLVKITNVWDNVASRVVVVAVFSSCVLSSGRWMRQQFTAAVWEGGGEDFRMDTLLKKVAMRGRSGAAGKEDFK